MNAFDHYAATLDLISRLRRAGYAAEAETLKAAMEGGATGTEILMALRFHLTDIVKRTPLTEETRTLASRLLTELGAELE